METHSAVNFKARLQRLIAYQDVLARNNLLAHRSCDQGSPVNVIQSSHLILSPSYCLEFSAFLKFHNDLRRKYADLRAHTDQMDRFVEQYRAEAARKDKKIQSQGYEIIVLFHPSLDFTSAPVAHTFFASLSITNAAMNV